MPIVRRNLKIDQRVAFAHAGPSRSAAIVTGSADSPGCPSPLAPPCTRGLSPRSPTGSGPVSALLLDARQQRLHRCQSSPPPARWHLLRLRHHGVTAITAPPIHAIVRDVGLRRGTTRLCPVVTNSIPRPRGKHCLHVISTHSLPRTAPLRGCLPLSRA
jgi:hypothetical protein